MIRATFNRQADQWRGFKLTGHADSDAYGHDIVCAAVSVLAISTVNGLQRVAQLPVTVESRDETGGLLVVTLQATTDQLAMIKGQAILETFRDGLTDVANNYQDYVMINDETH